MVCSTCVGMILNSFPEQYGKNVGDGLSYRAHTSLAVWSLWKVVRKHSPQRWWPERPSGQLRSFQRKFVNFRFFWAFEASKMQFRSNFPEAPVQYYLFPSQKCLDFKVLSKIWLLKRIFETAKCLKNLCLSKKLTLPFQCSNRNLETKWF